MGTEKLVKKTAVQEEEEKSFISKYWMHILLAVMILPRLLGGEESAEGEGAAAAQ